MLKRLLDASLRAPLIVVFVALLLASLGLRSLNALPIDAVPDVTNVQVQVLTDSPTLSPTEIERLITFPVENAMSGLPDVEEVRSVSRFGLSAVTVVFAEGTDIYFARQQVLERLQDARAAIPAGLGAPEMAPVSTGLGEVFQFELRADTMCPPGQEDREDDGCYSQMELRTLLDWFIAPRLRWVEGVVEVNSFGGELRTYEVQLEPERLTARGISLARVVEALRENNANAGGAYVVRAGEQRLIRGEAVVRTLADLERVVVETEGGAPTLIADLGDVRFAPMVRQGAVTRDGRGEAVTGIAMMRIGENSRTVVQGLRAELDRVAATLPPGVRVDVFYDRSELIDRTIRTVARNLIEGGVLVVLVLLLLLGSLRGGLLVASVIPLSMLGAFIAMELAGVAGNLMSLGAVDFGLIVDGAVVMLENVAARLGEARAARPERELSARERDRVARAAAHEVGRPVLFGVAIITVVYLPILSLGGIEGKLFRPMAFVVVFALLASLALALSFIPALARRVLGRRAGARETWLLRLARRIYEPALALALRRPGSVLALALAALVGAGALTTRLGAEFVPTLDEGAIAIQATRLSSVSLEQSVAMTQQVERCLLERFPDEVKTVISKTGRPEIATDPMGVNLSDIYVILRPRAGWTRARDREGLFREMRAALTREVPGQRYAFTQPIELRTNELISGVRSDVAISVYGDDLETLARLGDRVAAVVRALPGAVDVKAEEVAGLPVMRLVVNRDALARHGVDAGRVLEAIEAIGGLVVGEVFEGRRRFALQVRWSARTRAEQERLLAVPIVAADGDVIPLGALVRVELSEGPAQISRDRVQRRLTVELNVEGRDLAGFVAEAQAALEDAGLLPPNYWYMWRGQFQNLERAVARLAIVVPLTLLIVFMLLVMANRSLRSALLIFLNVPFAATGGAMALYCRDMPFSISAAVGFIALFGIAVLNGVVLVSRIREGQLAGLDRVEAAREAARARLRPVLMTALTDAIGFLPMAVATSAGAEVQRPLATVVIGGVLASTALTLIVLPAAWALLGPRVIEVEVELGDEDEDVHVHVNPERADTQPVTGETRGDGRGS